MRKYHYLYKIINIKNNKYYIGVRSCDCLPDDDLGKQYFSSSSDNQFMLEQNEQSNNFKYVILEVFKTRVLANKAEQKIHSELNVSQDIFSYNLSNARADFSMHNVKFTKEHRERISKSLKKLPRESNPMFGKRHTKKQN
jgi:hypothetical protein